MVKIVFETYFAWIFWCVFNGKIFLIALQSSRCLKNANVYNCIQLRLSTVSISQLRSFYFSDGLLLRFLLKSATHKLDHRGPD